MGILDNLKESLGFDSEAEKQEKQAAEAKKDADEAAKKADELKQKADKEAAEAAADDIKLGPPAPAAPEAPVAPAAPSAEDEAAKLERKAERLERKAERLERREERAEEREKFEHYTVKSGDTLSEIGQRYGVDYHVIAKLNDIENPDLIYPGQVFKIPAN